MFSYALILIDVWLIHTLGSDHLTLLHCYSQWKSNGYVWPLENLSGWFAHAFVYPACRYSDSWCTKHFLHAKGMRKAREVRGQLLDIMKMERLAIVPCGTDWDKIRFVVLASRYASFSGTDFLA
jgi:pre-mRNA-splicing factor ATP-dependent RNA helicase DHX38/PRP16